jgi:Flp pilus assembly protein TadD
VLNNLGALHHAEGDAAGAERRWREVLAEEGRAGLVTEAGNAALQNLATLLGQAGRYREAEALAVTLLERTPAGDRKFGERQGKLDALRQNGEDP